MKKSEKIILKAELRNLVGKKVKKLRKQGFIPANIFGSNFKSQSISVNLKDFIKAYKTVKETGILYIDLEKESVPALINYVQYHPVSDQILHVDFRKVDLNKKIETSVPVKIIGQSEAISQKGGVLLLQTDHLIIEALPEDIPQEITVDISSIKDVGQEIKVKDLKKDNKYEVKTEEEKVIVSVIKHKEESIAPDTTTTAPEVISETKEEGEKAASENTTTSSSEEKNKSPSQKQ